MTTAEKHIWHFNLMSGNQVRKDTLVEFYKKLPDTADLRELRSKVKKAINLIGNSEGATLRFDPIKYPTPVKKKVIRKLKPSVKKKKIAKPSVKRKAKKIEVTNPEGLLIKRSDPKPANALAGFTTADQPRASVKKIKPSGVMGELLGNLQPYKLVIIIPGQTHSSKSELGKQIVNALIPAMNEDAAIIDWEQGGLEADVTYDSIHRNIDPENIKRVHVIGDWPRTMESLKELSKRYKIVLLDSGTKLKQKNNDWIDVLREECPDTIWIILMQLTTDGATRGGASAEFDAPVVIKTYRPDHSTYIHNYGEVFKNRGNKTGDFYNIASKQMFQ